MTVDLRSDTVTKPTQAMRHAMATARVGDDVLGDEPTVQALEAHVAQLLGKPAACYTPSGTQANLLAITAHTRPGDEIIAAQGSHFFTYEAGGFAAVAGCSSRLIPTPDGLFEPERLDPLLNHDDDHFTRTRLVVLENTHNTGGGTPWPLPQLRAVADHARSLGLRTHIDGARLWNACTATGHSPAEYASAVDTVSVCFSKGLGAPVGSALVGDTPTIARARHLRKMFGGSMRQAGIVAAGALHALEHHRERLAHDHEHAQRLAHALADCPNTTIDPTRVHTNIVYFGVPDAPAIQDTLEARGVRLFSTGPNTCRAVTHLDADSDAIDRAISVLRDTLV